MKHARTIKRQAPAAPRKAELVGFVAGGPRLKPGDKLPTEFVAVPLGEMDARTRGKVICNEATLRGFEAWQKLQRRDHVMLDFNHNTLPGSAEREPRAKAAKLTAHAVPGVGIVCRVEYWTPEGEQYAGGGHFPDISPAVWRDENGVVLGLHSVALCEHGELSHGALEIFTADHPTEINTNNTPKTNSMDFRLLLCELLGLPKDASDEQITAAIAGKQGESTPAPEGMSASLTAFMAEVRTGMKTIQAELGQQKQATAEAKIDGFIAQATGERKDIKLDRATLVGFGVDGAKKYLDSLTPGVVPVSGAQQSNKNGKEASKGADKGGAKLHGFSAEEAKVLQDSGVSLEEAAKARDVQQGGSPEPEDDADEGDGKTD